MKKIIILLLMFISMDSMAQQMRSNPRLDSLKNEKNPAVLNERLRSLKNGSEDDLMLLVRYYGGNKVMTDSIINIGITKFPQGELAYRKYQGKMFGEPNVVQKEIIFSQIKAKFPNRDLTGLHHSLAYGYATSKNIPKVKENLALLPNFSSRVSSTKIMADVVVGYDLAAAESLLAKEVDQLVASGIPAESIAGGANGDARPLFLSYLNLYSTILIKLGKYDKALKYTEELYKSSKVKSDELKGNYGFLLSKIGKHQEAIPLLAPLVGEGKASQEFKNALVVSYSKVNPKEDANKYITEIEQGLASKARAEAEKSIVNEVTPNFVITDVNGKKVSLADFKGKTIVLDFWATWCMPCIKSFPAMQMAVNKYKNDPNVKFLFIHTWERAADPLTAAKNFLTTNNYKFDLFMDLKDPKTNLNPAIAGFGAKGIPVKFIIDGNGKTRFKLNGFSGGDDAAVAEISAMIDLLKKGV